MNETTDTSTEERPGPIALALAEQRVLGVLVEKQKTTADAYPMTVNALVAGCNQKTNRDPLLNLSAADVEATLEELNRRNLVVRVVSGRVDKWKHVLYEHWRVEKVELAVLAELFLRGPQTEGELRGRVGRMDPVDELDELRAVVRRLADRRFVVYLTPEGRRGTVVGHAFLDPHSLEQIRARFGDVGDHEASHAGRTLPAGFTVPGRLSSDASVAEELRKEIAEVRLQVGVIAARLDSLCQQLGITLPPPAP